MKAVLIMAAVCAASSVLASTFKIRADVAGAKGGEPVPLEAPKGAEKLAARYLRLAESTHPLLLEHAFAVVGGESPREDRNVEYVTRLSKNGKSLVLMIANRGQESATAELELKGKKPKEPVYRRVCSPDGGKTWTTVAWQPPRASDVKPWTIDVPSNTVQTVTIGIK